MHNEEKIFEMLFKEEDLRSKKQQLINDQNILDRLRRDLLQLKRKNSNQFKLDHYNTLEVLEQYCFDCHDEEIKKGNLDLSVPTIFFRCLFQCT